MMRALLAAVLALGLAFCSEAKVVCKDGVCYIEGAASAEVAAASRVTAVPRIAHGYMSADELIRFIDNRPVEREIGDLGLVTLLLVVLLGGLAMNLTPCVLPMVPVNMLIIGRSAKRGILYGIGMAVAYGTLGAVAALGGLSFGAIQSNPWFNVGVALVFALMGLSLAGVFQIDFSRWRGTFRGGAFLMGVLTALLAGACVAPMLISVLILAAEQVAAGNHIALALPFLFGVGMALPWPFIGAGVAILPKPGRWMLWVNRVFAIIVIGLAAWYGHLAYVAFTVDAQGQSLTPSTFESVFASASRPVFVDCWATWCKNCTAMEKVMANAQVKGRLRGFTVLRLQAENLDDLRRLHGFENVRGLPAFLIFE